MKINMFLSIAVIINLCFVPITLFAQNDKVVWSVFDMGYAVSSNVNATISSAIGQAFNGRSSQNNNFVESGFLGDKFVPGSPLGVKEFLGGVPDKYVLHQNFPNPFNPSTIIRYQLQATSTVTLKVFDLLGREVVTLVNEVQEPGYKQVEFDAMLYREMASSIYFYRITAVGTSTHQTFIDVRKMVLVK